MTAAAINRPPAEASDLLFVFCFCPLEIPAPARTITRECLGSDSCLFLTGLTDTSHNRKGQDSLEKRDGIVEQGILDGATPVHGARVPCNNTSCTP